MRAYMCTVSDHSLVLKIRVPDDPSNKFALLLRNVLSVGSDDYIGLIYA
jgi:hypothetical protein